LVNQALWVMAAAVASTKALVEAVATTAEEEPAAEAVAEVPVTLSSLVLCTPTTTMTATDTQ
jgi:hypothetical protein